MSRDVVIVDAIRTPVGTMGGALRDVSPEDLGTLVVKELLDRTKIDPAVIDEVIFGQVKISADAPNIARTIGLMAGIPIEVPAYVVTRQCGSGMQAVMNGVMQIQTGNADVVLAGGTESMSKAIYYLRNARYGYGVGNAELVDSNTESQFKSQPEEIYGHFNMGITAENLAEKYNISREEQDLFGYNSQQKAWAAIRSGKFKEEIVPVPIKQKKGDPILFDTDEHPRETSLEKMAKLKPVFKEGGTVTAGNSSGRNDGAAALLLMTEDKAKDLGLKPIVKFLSQASAGVDPRIMGIGPVPATKKALQRAGLTLDQIGLIELNEAFAAQSLAVIKEIGFNQDILNVNGGAIALGHPLGATGARLLTTLIYEMRRRNTKYGLATLCVAGGLGLANVVELC